MTDETSRVDRYAQLEMRILREEYWSAKPRNKVDLLHDWGLAQPPQEVGYVIAMDGMRNIRTVIEVARGSHGTLDIHIPTVLRAALMGCGERFTFVHCHPSANAIPTPADIRTTDVLQAAGATIGLILEDHLIVTPKRDVYYSFVESGLYVPADYTDGFQITTDEKGKILEYDPVAAAQLSRDR